MSYIDAQESVSSISWSIASCSFSFSLISRLFILFFSWTNRCILVAGLNLLIFDCTQCLTSRLESAYRSQLFISLSPHGQHAFLLVFETFISHSTGPEGGGLPRGDFCSGSFHFTCEVYLMSLRPNALVILQSRDCITPSWRCPCYSFTGLHSVMLPFSAELLMSCESGVLAPEWHTLGLTGNGWSWHCPLFGHSCCFLTSVEGLSLLWLKGRRWWLASGDYYFFLNSDFITPDESQEGNSSFHITIGFCCYCHDLIVFIFIVKAFKPNPVKTNE